VVPVWRPGRAPDHAGYGERRSSSGQPAIKSTCITRWPSSCAGSKRSRHVDPLWSIRKTIGRLSGGRTQAQSPLFTADLLALSIKLIVEVDGSIHVRKPGPDAGHDPKLQRAGFRFVLVSAKLVRSDLAASR
jgi:hypothetical protein